MRKRRVSRIITSIIDKDGVTQKTTRGILYNFFEFLQSKYESIHVDDTVLLEWRMIGIGPYRWDEGTVKTLPTLKRKKRQR